MMRSGMRAASDGENAAATVAGDGAPRRWAIPNPTSVTWRGGTTAVAVAFSSR